MRNLKRALSLALASVMVMGMMVVGTSASYKDVSSDVNQEAIEVLQAVGIMVGDENGNFNPDAKVTRNEMAVIMSNLMDYRVASYKGTSPFTDVPAWAEPYVAACYTNGITSGIGGTLYGGDQTVTTAQAALMVMKALGYFQYQSDFGDDWELETIKQAGKIDLFDDVESGVREAMTRNDVAQLVLNTLESGTVEAEKNGQDISANGVTITSSVSYKFITSGKDYAKAVNDKLATYTDGTHSTGYIVELGEKLYNGDLKLKDDTSDDFGAPANRWTYKNIEVGTYAENADYTFTGTVKSSAMYDAVGKTAARDYKWTVIVDGGADVDVFTQKDVEDNDKDDLDGTARGTYTYVYLDDKATGSYAGTATVVIKNTYVAEVTKVKDGTITLDDMDDSGLEFDIEGYDEEDVVLYTKAISGKEWDVQEILGLAQLVEGEATLVREKDRVEVDGTTYRYSNRFNDDNGDKLGVASVDENVAFYLDLQGHIIRMEDASESNDYAYVYSVGDASNKYGDDADFGAKLILTDGTIMKIDIDSDTTDPMIKNVTPAANQSQSAANLAAVEKKLVDQIVSYSEEDDGSYSLTIKTTNTASWNTPTEDVVKNGTSRVKLDNGYIYTDKYTAVVVNEEQEDNDEFDAYVGYESAPDVDAVNGTKLVAYVDSKNIAKAIFIIDAEVSGSSKDVVFVLGANPKLNESNKQFYVYDAVIDGEAKSIKVKAGSEAYTTLSKIAKDDIGVYFGYTENSDGYITKLTTKIPTDVEINGIDKDDQTNANNANASKYQVGDYNSVVYTGIQRESNGGNVSVEFINGKYTIACGSAKDAVIAYYDGHDLTKETSVKTDSKDEALIITDDGKIIAIYVRDYENDENKAPELSKDIEVQSVNLDEGEITYYVEAGKTSLSNSDIKAILESKGCTNIKVDANKVWTYTYDGMEVSNQIKATQVYKVTVKVDSKFTQYYTAKSDVDYAKEGGQVVVTVTAKTGNITNAKTASVEGTNISANIAAPSPASESANATLTLSGITSDVVITVTNAQL